MRYHVKLQGFVEIEAATKAEATQKALDQVNLQFVDIMAVDSVSDDDRFTIPNNNNKG